MMTQKFTHNFRPTIPRDAHALSGNSIGLHLNLPSDWQNSVLQPDDYITFAEDINQGLDNKPLLGFVLDGNFCAEIMPGVVKIANYIDTIKQSDGSVTIDRNGSSIHTHIKTLSAHRSIIKYGILLSPDRQAVEQLRYGLDHMILETGNLSDLTAYMEISTNDMVSTAQTCFSVLQDYGITSCVMSFSDLIDQEVFKYALKNRKTIFDNLQQVNQLSIGHGVTDLALEDYYEMFRDHYESSDIIFFTLRRSLKVFLNPDGHVSIVGGNFPYHAGQWTPEINAFDLVISTLRSHNDPIWRRIMTPQKPRVTSKNITTRSAIWATTTLNDNTVKEKTL